MIRLRCEVSQDSLPAASVEGEIAVWLYGARPPASHVGVVGADLVDKFERLSLPPSAASVDLVSIAMAVTAADTFVLRDAAADGWRREILVDLPLAQPERWQPLEPLLARLLGFLSGDSWSFSFRGGGRRPPSRMDVRRRIAASDPTRSECVALFSGGLDSALGVIDLTEQSRRPLLVSHAGRGDAKYQADVARQLPQAFQLFDFNSYPSREGQSDVSMRTRSLQFLAVAAMAADTLSSFRGGSEIELFMCENGLIAINPPLTVRRIGAHSTRTAHPHYLSLLQDLLRQVDIPVVIRNPHRHETKGQMLLRHSELQNISRFASSTVSCGKWKRANQQCGRCLPCLIRRASFHAAKIPDITDYGTMQLKAAVADQVLRDDVVSVQNALKRRYERNLKAWVLQSGPLPVEPYEREAYFHVVEQGMDELEAYFASEGLHV